LQKCNSDTACLLIEIRQPAVPALVSLEQFVLVSACAYLQRRRCLPCAEWLLPSPRDRLKRTLAALGHHRDATQRHPLVACEEKAVPMTLVNDRVYSHGALRAHVSIVTGSAWDGWFWARKPFFRPNNRYSLIFLVCLSQASLAGTHTRQIDEYRRGPGAEWEGERGHPKYESACGGEENLSYRACLLRASVTLLRGLGSCTVCAVTGRGAVQGGVRFRACESSRQGA